MSPTSWEHFEHRADIGVRGFGRTPAEAFARATEALTAVVTSPEKVALATTIRVRIQAPDLEMLFVDWLNRVVLEMACRHMLFRRFDVAVDGTTLSATLAGEPVDQVRHAPAVEVKAATYAELRVVRAPGGAWLAQCILDV